MLWDGKSVNRANVIAYNLESEIVCQISRYLVQLLLPVVTFYLSIDAQMQTGISPKGGTSFSPGREPWVDCIT